MYIPQRGASDLNLWQERDGWCREVDERNLRTRTGTLLYLPEKLGPDSGRLPLHSSASVRVALAYILLAALEGLSG